MSEGRDSRAFLRHTVATLAYRGAKAVRGAPESFAQFRAAPDSRSPLQILAHIGDLLDWCLSIAEGREAWHDATPRAWSEEVERFHGALARLDAFLASSKPLGAPAERLFQGPIADALTHVGQIAMLRRLAGMPIKGENYSRAEIVGGRVGSEQTPPPREFD
jgi:hypothetical protein